MLIQYGFGHPIGLRKYGVQESRRVERGLSIVERDDYAAAQPLRLHDVGSKVFHFRSMNSWPKAICLPDDIEADFKLGHYRFLLVLTLLLHKVHSFTRANRSEWGGLSKN